MKLFLVSKLDSIFSAKSASPVAKPQGKRGKAYSLFCAEAQSDGLWALLYFRGLGIKSPKRSPLGFGSGAKPQSNILKILKETNMLRLILGYMVGITIFLFVLPLLFIKASLFLDKIFALSPFLPPPLGWLIALPIVLFGLFWALWSNIFLLIEGRGGPVEGFGVAISPPTKKLVVKGPYRYTRNPMVFGTLTIYLGIGFYISSPSYILFVLPCFWLATYVILTLFEEKRLIRDFGNQYIEYKRQVPMYFPGNFFLKPFRKNP